MSGNKVIEYIIAAKDQTGDAINSALGKARSFASGVAQNLANIKAGFDMASGVVRNFASVFGTAIKEAFKFEKVQSDFTGLLNSVDKAKEHIADLRKFASSTPLTFEDLSKASKLLLSFGMNVDEVMPSLKMLGDIAMGDSQKFDGLALVFAQVKSAGKLMGQDLLQMINQGFNPLTVIAKETGRSMSELKDIMSEGGISFEMVAEAMKVATSEGGLFNNAMSNASKTGEGLISTLQDKWTDVVRTFGDAFVDTAKGGLQTLIDKLTELVENGDVEVWANKIAKGLESVTEVATSCAKAMNWLAEAYQSVKNVGERVGDSVGSFVGTLASGGSLKDAWDNAGEAAQNTVNNQVLSELAEAEEEAAIRARAKSRAASGVGTGSASATAADISQSPLVQECTAAVDAVKETTVKHANSLASMLSDAMGKSVTKADKLIQSQLKQSLSELEKKSAAAQTRLSSASAKVDSLLEFYKSDDPGSAYAESKASSVSDDEAWQRFQKSRRANSTSYGDSIYDSYGNLRQKVSDSEYELARALEAALEEERAAYEYARATSEAAEEAAEQLKKLNKQIEEGRAE